MDTGDLEMTAPLIRGDNKPDYSSRNRKSLGTLAEEDHHKLIHGRTMAEMTRYETSQDEDFYYILQFPNPYDKHSLFNSESKKISISDCEEMIRKTFKVFETREKFYHTLRGSTEMSSGTTSEAKLGRQEMILEAWNNFKSTGKQKKLSYRKFLEHIMNTIFEVLQWHLKFKIEFIYSRDDDEIFVKIWASEENLKIHADVTDYLLQLRYDPTQEKTEYNRIPPHAQFDMTLDLPGQSFGQSQSKNIENLYKHYDKYDKEVKAGSVGEDSSSLFCYKDKVRLIYDQMCTVFDPDYMYEVGLMKGHYPVHNYKNLAKLKKKWVYNWRFWKKMDLKKVRLYFGEKIAMYFAWLEFYTRWMMFSSVIGIVVYIVEKVYGDLGEKNSSMSVSEAAILGFTFLLCLSASVIDMFWVRKEKYIALKWGTSNLDNYEGQRPAFEGDYKKDTLTGRFKKFSTHKYKTIFQKVTNMSVVLFFVMLVLAIIFSIFMWRAIRIEAKASVTICGIVMGIQIQIMTIVYFKVAKWLNDKENHETMTDYNDALTLKLYLFQFVNCYASLFYIAFVKRFFEGCYENDCMTELSDSLFYIFMVNFITNILDILIP